MGTMKIMETRLDRILEARLPEDYLVVKVHEDNITNVLALETTTVAASKDNLMGYKNIVMVTNNKLAAVGVIEDVCDYDPKTYFRAFSKKNINEVPWRSTVKFSNTIIVGGRMKDIFGDKNRLIHVQTFMWFTAFQEIKQLAKALNTSYLFNIHNTLSDLGVIQN